MTRNINARLGLAVASGALALVLAGCSGGSATPSGDATVATTTTATTMADAAAGTTAGTTAGTPQGSDDFCAMAIDAVAAADELSAGMKDLDTAMSSNDIDALHKAGRAIVDYSPQATAFYKAGANAAEDQATKDAFNGMTDFVSKYSVLMGQAAVDATSVSSFMVAVATILNDPDTVPLLTQAADWANTVKDFSTTHCSLT